MHNSLLQVPPDLITYNLVLRAIRDTTFGDCKPQDLLCEGIASETIVIDDNRPNLLAYPPVLSYLPVTALKTNLLPGEKHFKPRARTAKKEAALVPTNIDEIDLNGILKLNKLILFGGMNGFLENMKVNRITPDVKTLTYLIDLVPGSAKAEEMIIQYARTTKVTLDIDFFNMLMKKRAVQMRYAEARVGLLPITCLQFTFLPLITV